jgi:hypothetical protein
MKMPFPHTTAYKLLHHIYMEGPQTMKEMDRFMVSLGLTQPYVSRLFRENALGDFLVRADDKYDIKVFVIQHFNPEYRGHQGEIVKAPYKVSVYASGPLQSKYLPEPPYRPEGQISKEWKSKQL